MRATGKEKIAIEYEKIILQDGSEVWLTVKDEL